MKFCRYYWLVSEVERLKREKDLEENMKYHVITRTLLQISTVEKIIIIFFLILYVRKKYAVNPKNNMLSFWNFYYFFYYLFLIPTAIRMDDRFSLEPWE